MKIAVWHNLPSGGGKRAAYYFVRGLVERGHELESWSLDTADRSYLPLNDFATEHITPTDDGVTGDKRRFDLTKAVDQMRAFDRACRHTAEEIDRGNFDVVFVNGSQDFGVPYVTRHLRTKKVLYVQEPRRYLYEASPALPWVATAPEDLEQVSLFSPGSFISDYPLLQTLRLQAKQEWLSVRASDEVLVNSYFSREAARRIYGIDAKVCYLGVDTELFCDTGLPRERFIVGMGSFGPTKGVDLAVGAVGLLPEPRPPLVWIANATDPNYRESTARLAQSLGVDLQIRSAIPDTEVISILNRASLMLYTSRLEPFGLAPLEANACGTPVVGIAEGGIRETVEDGVNGYLVDPDPESLAHAIESLLQDPVLARQMGERARAHVERKWSVENSVDRLETFLEQAISQA